MFIRVRVAVGRLLVHFPAIKRCWRPGAVTHPAGACVASARAQFQCIVHFLMLPDACCLCMLLVQVDEAGASSVVDGRDVSSADAASAGMVKVCVLFSSFDQFHVHACACWYISCSTPLVLLLYSLRAHVCVHTVHPAVALRPCANFESMTHEHAS